MHGMTCTVLLAFVNEAQICDFGYTENISECIYGKNEKLMFCVNAMERVKAITADKMHNVLTMGYTLLCWIFQHATRIVKHVVLL